jgi:hypothetical protein
MAFIPDMNGLPMDSIGRVTKALGAQKESGSGSGGGSPIPSFLSMGLAGVLLDKLLNRGGGNASATPEQPFQPQTVDFSGGGQAAAPPSGGFGRIGRERRGGF